jgi:hypothetical protein
MAWLAVPGLARAQVQPLAPPMVMTPVPGGCSGGPGLTIWGRGEPLSRVGVHVDGVLVGEPRVDADGAWSFSSPALLAEGEHELRVSSLDAAGEASALSEPLPFTVNMLPPETRIVKAPQDVVDTRRADFEFASDDPRAHFQCSLDGHGFFPCDNPLRLFSRIHPGQEHTLAVRAIDACGRMDPTPVSYTWRVILAASVEEPEAAGCSSAEGSPALLLIGLVAISLLSGRRGCVPKNRVSSGGCSCCR